MTTDVEPPDESLERRVMVEQWRYLRGCWGDKPEFWKMIADDTATWPAAQA